MSLNSLLQSMSRLASVIDKDVAKEARDDKGKWTKGSSSNEMKPGKVYWIKSDGSVIDSGIDHFFGAKKLLTDKEKKESTEDVYSTAINKAYDNGWMRCGRFPNGDIWCEPGLTSKQQQSLKDTAIEKKVKFLVDQGGTKFKTLYDPQEGEW